MGVSEDIQGRSYGLPTMEGIDEFRLAAQRFVAYVRSRPDLEFWLTKVGCGIAGYSEDDVRPMFAPTPDNVIKPLGW